MKRQKRKEREIGRRGRDVRKREKGEVRQSEKGRQKKRHF